MKHKRILALCVAFCMLVCLFASCGDNKYKDNKVKAYSYSQALTELSAFNKDIKCIKKKPVLDIYEDSETTVALADIDTFPLTVTSGGDINIEIAAATELSSDAPDDWINIIAKNFNRENNMIGNKKVTVSVRKITSGEVLTYMTDGNYKPDVYIPSNDAWGKMLQSKGVGTVKLSDRILGNTAGILMKKNVYNSFVKKYKTVNLQNVIEASLKGDINFAYTNPYTSSTGLNILTSTLYAFDKKDPLSEKAQAKLLDYQKKSPPVAYTTAVLKNQAAKGIINTMVMEEQAYINTPELKGYTYIPAGIRHDHPVYTFDYVSNEKQQAAELFVKYCLTTSSQKLGTEKGFNRHDNYKSKDTGMTGTDYLSAQRIWKQNKDGGQPVIAMFVADVSGSMSGERLNALKKSLISTSQYINSDNYIGLMSYSGNVYINLPLDKFEAKQKAYFTGTVKGLQTEGNTATYNAVLVALQKLVEKQKKVPNAKAMLFVLSDGESNTGYTLNRILPIVAGIKIPVYSIGYHISDLSSTKNQLKELSEINEAAFINSSSDDIVNQLRNLFNTQL